MSDHEARARKIATEYETMCVSAGIGRPFGFSGLYLVILEALRTVRRETLEEAAQVADNYARDGRTHKELACETADEIAARIRSLAVKEGEGV